ncbi:MAG: TetR/AcrR family transcriptional regulator [Nitrospinota bacterium]
MTETTDPKDTKERILDTAERVFAEQGINACSIRFITSEAGVNLASVHYHFGSKEGLVRAVLERRIDPMNRERIERLNAVEAEAGDGPPSLEKIFEALIRPYLRVALDPARGEMVMHLFARVLAEPDLRAIIAEVYNELVSRFTAVCKRALPDLPPEELCWRIHLAFGVWQAISNPLRLRGVSSILVCDPSAGEEEIIERMLSFVIAGMNAPLPAKASSEATQLQHE